VGLYEDRTGADRDEIARMMDATTFMAGEKAVEAGFADDLLPADKVTKVSNSTAPARAPQGRSGAGSQRDAPQ
jgi:hypothetical protein